MKSSKNLEMLSVVAKGLGDLKKEVVFVGGATIGLYTTDEGATDVRLTDDVDFVVEITTRVKYYAFEEKLRKLNFKQPKVGEEGHPICRWVYSGIYVDVMPTMESVLGFSNKWYEEGIANAIKTTLPDGQEISIFSVPYLMASKIEAFLGRGKDDFLASSDLEDIVILTDGCPEIAKQISQASQKVKTYLKKQIKELLAKEKFVDSVYAHIESANPRQGSERAQKVIKTFQEIAA